MPKYLQGAAELYRKLGELKDPKANVSVLRSALKEGAKEVEHRARSNLIGISPGEAPWHRTYKGRLVGRGFALGSIASKVITSRDKTKVSALIGVRPEAYYVVQFFERGTALIPRQPWLVPALESSQGHALQRVVVKMRQRIERIARKRGAR